MELYVLNGKVVNVRNGRPTYGASDESARVEVSELPKE